MDTHIQRRGWTNDMFRTFDRKFPSCDANITSQKTLSFVISSTMKNLLLLLLRIESFFILLFLSNFVQAKEEQQQQIQRSLQVPGLQQAQQDLNKARSLWDSFNSTEYCYHVLSHARTYNLTFGLHIKNGQVFRLNAADSDFNQNIAIFPEIPYFFRKIQRGISKSADVNVTYDSMYGYPTTFDLDFHDNVMFLVFTSTIRGEIQSFVPISEHLQRMNYARYEQWERLQYVSYDTVYMFYQNYEQEVHVSVRNNQVAQVWVRNEEGILVDETESFLSSNNNHVGLLVSEKWKELDKALTADIPTKFDVEYHPIYGYPKHVSIEFETFNNHGDRDEIAYSILTLTPFLSTGGQQQLLSAVSLWESKNVNYYSMKIQKFCEACALETQRPMIAVVQGGAVQSLTLLDGTVVDKPGDSVESIEQLFSAIQTAFLSNAYVVAVVYNEVYGYPETISLDYTPQSGDEVWVQVEMLEPYLDATATISAAPTATPSAAPTTIDDRTGNDPTGGICIPSYELCPAGSTCCNSDEVCSFYCRRPRNNGAKKGGLKAARPSRNGRQNNLRGL